MNQPVTATFDALASEIDRHVDLCFPALVDLRRYLHANPEPSGEEYNTAKYLRHWLDQHGISTQSVVDERGILCDLDGGEIAASERFGLRADIDALRLQDQKDVTYRSQVENVMHACGHDVHATILSGALLVLRRLIEFGGLPCPIAVRGIYQPAEETCVGARQMIEAGALDGVEGIFAVHVDPSRNVGTLACKSGVMNATCDVLHILVEGAGGHAARPHQTRDPITAAAQFLNLVHVQVPRGADSLDTVVIGFGSIHGGNQSNVIPDHVDIEGTLRALTEETREATIHHLREIARGVGDATKTQITLTLGAGTLSVRNDPQLFRQIMSMIVRLYGEAALDVMSQPSMGGEDFAYYLQHVPGGMVRLGCRPAAGPMTPLHTTCFDVDEDVIRIGVRLMVHTAIEWFHREFTRSE